jgi:hypothetical protein
MTRHEDAHRLLDEVRAANDELAKRAVAPVWYHPALGLLSGGYVAVQAAPIAARLIYLAVFLLGLAGLVHAYRRKTGMWVSGFRAGRTRWVAIALMIVMILTYAVAAWLELRVGVHGAFLIGGAILAVVTTAQGFLWEAAFRRDLREDAGL